MQHLDKIVKDCDLSSGAFCPRGEYEAYIVPDMGFVNHVLYPEVIALYDSTALSVFGTINFTL